MSDASLSLLLLTGLEQRRIEGIGSLTAADASGQFGLLPGHQTLVTRVQPGLVSYRLQGDETQRHYLASSGGTLSCHQNLVTLVAARILADTNDPEQLLRQLDLTLATEQASRQSAHQSRANLEQALLKRLNQWTEAGR